MDAKFGQTKQTDAAPYLRDHSTEGSTALATTPGDIVDQAIAYMESLGAGGLPSATTASGPEGLIKKWAPVWGTALAGYVGYKALGPLGAVGLGVVALRIAKGSWPSLP